jgi:hypothetical protein
MLLCLSANVFPFDLVVPRPFGDQLLLSLHPGGSIAPITNAEIADVVFVCSCLHCSDVLPLLQETRHSIILRSAQVPPQQVNG